MILGACGFGATGSSVLTDLLSDYGNVQIHDSHEFVTTYLADGLEDLEYHLMKQYSKGESCDIAIRRFLKRSKCYMLPFVNKPCNGKLYYQYSKEFIEEITQFKFRGVYTADMYTGNLIRDFLAFFSKKLFIPNVLEKILKKRVYIWPCHEIYYSVEPDNFYEAAKRYTEKILKAANLDTGKIICLDQPFCGNAPQNSMKFFRDSFAIVIDRDPRDLYLSAKYTKDPNYKFCPTDNPEQFAIYYKTVRKHIDRYPNNVLYLHFEDFIYKYEETINLLEDKLGLCDRKNKKTFDPSKSINNTQLIRLHPEDKEEILFLTNELSEYLYDFDRYRDYKFEGKPFDGAARKAFIQK